MKQKKTMKPKVNLFNLFNAIAIFVVLPLAVSLGLISIPFAIGLLFLHLAIVLAIGLTIFVILPLAVAPNLLAKKKEKGDLKNETKKRRKKSNQNKPKTIQKNRQHETNH